jgi:1,4-dihydroxy-2-naphthoate polyprenyltransferase
MKAGIVQERGTTWRIWIAAMRPRTLPAAVAPVVVGCALSWRAGAFSPSASALCLAFALLVQIGANFANDYYDFVHGADNRERVGPVRAVAAGLVQPAGMKRAMCLVFGLAFATGLALIPWGGWWLVAVGAACIASAIAYTGGPYPLGYHGLGDLFVFVFFGLVAVGATFYVQAGRMTAASLLAGASVGALATNILLVNNYRDAASDARAGKHTLVVRFGQGFARGQFAAAHAVAAATPLLLAALGLLRFDVALVVGVVAAVSGAVLGRRLRRASSAAECIGLLGQSSGYLAAYAVLLSGALVAG